MKKLTSILLAALMSFYGVMALSPVLVQADNGHGHGNGHGNNGKHESSVNTNDSGGNQNHGSVVSAVARSHSSEAEQNGATHGSVVSAVARQNHGEEVNSKEDQNENENEDNENENGNGGGQHNAFQFSNISAVPAATSSVISWNTDQPTLGMVLFGTNSGSLSNNVSESTTTLGLTHQVTLTGLTPNTVYFYAIKTQDASSTMEQSGTFSFITQATTTPDTTPPSILFATNLGLSASTTSLIWTTNEASDSKIWVSTTSPVSTSTAPFASSGALSFFHQLNLPGLATSTMYFYTISSMDSSGNTGFFSNSFTTPAI